MDHTLYSISIDQKNARPQVVLRDCSNFPVVSPDERYVADHQYRELRIIELAGGEIVRRWLIPPRPRGGLFVNWSPDGRELSVCGWDGSETGLWIYNMETEDAVKIMGLYATTARWSGGEHPKLAIAFGMPLTEIWMWELKPGASTADSFGFVQTVEEYCRWAIDLCSYILTMDPDFVDIHYMRVDYALWIGHERTQEFLEDFDAAMKPEHYSAGSCAAFCDLVLRSVPELQKRLMPMVLLMARKAVDKEPENVDFLKTLGEALYHSEDRENAEETLRRAFDLSLAGSDLDEPQTSEVIQLLIRLYESWGKPEEADKWRAELHQKTGTKE